MATLKDSNFLDLNVSVPRSSKEKMADIVHLPRMIDKARAHQADSLGEYIYPCPLDRQVLRFLEVDSDDFAKLTEKFDDDQLTEWTLDQSRNRTLLERQALHNGILNRKVHPKHWVEFKTMRDQIDPTRTDVTTWDGLTDLEEGHI